MPEICEDNYTYIKEDERKSQMYAESSYVQRYGFEGKFPKNIPSQQSNIMYSNHIVSTRDKSFGLLT